MTCNEIHLIYQQKDFGELDLPALIMKIWNYSHMQNYKYCIVPATYRTWCIDELKKKWKDTYLDFNLFVEKLCSLDEEWAFVAKRTEKNVSNLYKRLKENYMSDIARYM